MNPAAFSPAADRNKQAIVDVLLSVLPSQGHALEIASGTGQHAAWFAAGLPRWTWQPTDVQSGAFDSISAWVNQAGLVNVKPPLQLDVMNERWLPESSNFDLIFCANMIHIAPWATCTALMRGSARHLTPGGRLVTYGPYFEDGVISSDGNLSFDKSLRSQNTQWGIRNLKDVTQAASIAGLQLAERMAMPANNLLLVWSS